jgi:hypothetical protein
VITPFPEACDDNNTLPNPYAIIGPGNVGPSIVQDNYAWPTLIPVPRFTYSNADGCSEICQVIPGWVCQGGTPYYADYCDEICGDGLDWRHY